VSHLVIVGASTGIGRDVQPRLRELGHEVTAMRRRQYPSDADGPPWYTSILLCQRYRGEASPYRGSGALADKEWTGEMDVSLDMTRQIIERAGHQMRGGSIVVMASVAAVSVEEEQPVSYHACKAALVEMVKYYAVTLGPKQIRVNAIIPGLTIKPEARAFYDAHPELEALYTDITPLGRMGTVEDIAHLVDFLISDRSSYLTGQTITLDGGISLRSPWALARRVTPTLRDLPVTQKAAAHV
jgi:NAD(P)-dependent dehydrogenase (short-subunit alcohol dehydrogenase family)